VQDCWYYCRVFHMPLLFDFDMLLNFIVVYNFSVIDVEGSCIVYGMWFCCCQLMECHVCCAVFIIIINNNNRIHLPSKKAFEFWLVPFFIHKVLSLATFRVYLCICPQTISFPCRSVFTLCCCEWERLHPLIYVLLSSAKYNFHTAIVCSWFVHLNFALCCV
jgi:hypothetical protein